MSNNNGTIFSTAEAKDVGADSLRSRHLQNLQETLLRRRRFGRRNIRL